jgi:hypothetical protein
VKQSKEKVGKPVNLGPGLDFPSITAAEAYFGKILRESPRDKTIENPNHKALKRLYEQYCANTDWPIPSPVKRFFPRLEQQKGFTTTCFGIEFKDGTTGKFSMYKALVACANGPKTRRRSDNSRPSTHR